MEKKKMEVIKVRTICGGISDFKRIVERNGFYIDKSMLIAEILESGWQVQLFTRPRRFGKTTNLMMLKEFFNIEKKEENKNLFTNLKISNTQYIKTDQGKYPVIFISFKDIRQTTKILSQKSVKNLIGEVYKNFRYLLEFLKEDNKKYFYKILNVEDDVDYENSIKFLCQCLYEYWGEKVIILIDEYDTPLITAYVEDYYEEIVSFYRILYGKAFKDNEYLEKAIITGINRIGKEGMFSGLNNLVVNTVLSKKYEKYFGFTEDEVKEMLIEYKLENEFENVKKWYDGYKFNKISIYNPWSIINYLENREFGIYWINTSHNLEITKFLGEITYKTEGVKIFQDLEILAKGGIINTKVNEDVLFKNLTTSTELWNLMLNAGYLTSEGKIKFEFHQLKIPNYEIQKYFADAFIENFIEKKEYFNNILFSIVNGEMDNFEKELKEYILNSSSYMVSDKEVFYQGFMLGLFMMLKEYYIADIEREVGYGRADLYLESINNNDISYVIELKIANNETEFKKLSEKALTQIKEKKYYTKLVKNKNKIILVGITFFNKMVDFKYEQI